MIADLKPYPAMKDSGVEWLRELPEHWNVWRSRYLFTEIDRRSKTGEETHLSMSQRLGLVPSDQVQSSLTSESYAGGKLCEPEDLVLNRLKAHLGVFALAKQAGVISPDYSVFRRRCASDMTYFEQALRSPACRGELRIRAKGIVEGFWRLYTDDFYDIRLPVPPLPEQAAIVRHLEHVDRRVRQLVRAKRRLIALLTEQKQAIIHRAVTRGLDPDVPLKDSGVEWLGEVPEHWEVRRLFQACDVMDPHPSHRNPPLVADGVPFLGVGDLNIDGDVVKVSHRVGRDVLADQNARFQIEDGDLAIGRVASVGKVVRLRPGDICLSGRLAVLKPKIGSDFLFYCLGSRSTQHQITVGTDLTTMGVLGLNKLKRIHLCVPPVHEQSLLVQHINEATASIDPAIARANREIDLLNEYQTRLIADVVTGKLDVREAAATLPEVDPLAADDEPIDALDADAEADFDEVGTTLEEVEA